MTMATFRQLGLRPAQVKALDQKAKQQGKTRTQFLRWIIERELAAQSFDEILKPVRDDFRKSGITESELDELVDRARSSAYKKKPREARR